MRERGAPITLLLLPSSLSLSRYRCLYLCLYLCIHTYIHSFIHSFAFLSSPSPFIHPSKCRVLLHPPPLTVSRERNAYGDDPPCYPTLPTNKTNQLLLLLQTQRIQSPRVNVRRVQAKQLPPLLFPQQRLRPRLRLRLLLIPRLHRTTSTSVAKSAPRGDNTKVPLNQKRPARTACGPPRLARLLRQAPPQHRYQLLPRGPWCAIWTFKMLPRPPPWRMHHCHCNLFFQPEL